MQKVLRVFEALALAALIALLGELAWTVHRLRPKLEVTISNLDRTVIIAGAAATHLEKAAGTWEQASKEQASKTTKAMSDVSVAAASFSTFASHTDKSVNFSLLPIARQAIDQQNAALLTSQKDLQANLSQMLQATQQFQRTLVAAEGVIGDPKLREILADTDEDIKQLKPMLESGTATAEDVQRVADKIADQYTKARNIWIAGAQWLVQRAWELRGAVGF
jgi:hypothetical protein